MAGGDVIAGRYRLDAEMHGVFGLVASEVPRPIGNQLNDDLIRELIRSATLVPTDLHRLDDGADGQIATPHTVVLAEELSADAVLAGIRAGRSWIAESDAIELAVEISAGDRIAGIGERLPVFDRPATMRVDISGVPSGTVSIHTDRGRVHRESLPSDASSVVEWCTSADESAFVRIEVRHPDGRMAALSNPIILV